MGPPLCRGYKEHGVQVDCAFHQKQPGEPALGTFSGQCTWCNEARMQQQCEAGWRQRKLLGSEDARQLRDRSRARRLIFPLASELFGRPEKFRWEIDREGASKLIARSGLSESFGGPSTLPAIEVRTPARDRRHLRNQLAQFFVADAEVYDMATRRIPFDYQKEIIDEHFVEALRSSAFCTAEDKDAASEAAECEAQANGASESPSETTAGDNSDAVLPREELLQFYGLFTETSDDGALARDLQEIMETMGKGDAYGQRVMDHILNASRPVEAAVSPDPLFSDAQLKAFRSAWEKRLELRRRRTEEAALGESPPGAADVEWPIHVEDVRNRYGAERRSLTVLPVKAIEEARCTEEEFAIFYQLYTATTDTGAPMMNKAEIMRCMGKGTKRYEDFRAVLKGMVLTPRARGRRVLKRAKMTMQELRQRKRARPQDFSQDGAIRNQFAERAAPHSGRLRSQEGATGTAEYILTSEQKELVRDMLGQRNSAGLWMFSRHDICTSFGIDNHQFRALFLAVRSRPMSRARP